MDNLSRTVRGDELVLHLNRWGLWLLACTSRPTWQSLHTPWGSPARLPINIHASSVAAKGPSMCDSWAGACLRCHGQQNPLRTTRRIVPGASSWRTVSLVDRAALCRLLAYDKRRTTGASRGLALTSDYAPLGLLKGDRLEPCLERPDVATFFLPDGFPGRVLFWRVSEE